MKNRLPIAGLLGLALVATLPGLVAGPANAATQQVTITANGYVPQNFNIETGDTVTYTNSDNTPHEVQFKPSTGMTCTPTPFVVQPTKQASCTFSAAGTYTVSDPNDKNNTYKGQITVTAAAPTLTDVSIAASDSVVVYGASVTLSGKTNVAKAGISVDILAKEFGESAFTKLDTVKTDNDGNYTYDAEPRIATDYKAHAVDGSKQADSSATTVKVRPRVALIKRYVHGTWAGFRASVRALKSHEGAEVLVQRKTVTGRWSTKRTATLTQFSSVSFRVRIPMGASTWRVVLPASQAVDGYLSGFSNESRVVR